MFRTTRSTRHWTDVALLASAVIFCTALSSGTCQFGRAAESIPLPEHPRPDFQRPDWLNLNGTWKLRFDAEDVGENQQWQQQSASFPRQINVPFPWGSPASGVADEADVAWYGRTIRVPEAWASRRVFLVVGACDWHTTAWIDGKPLGKHRGGYTPFEFELTPHVKHGQDQVIVLRVDDAKRPFKLEGKQGYGPARGIWQTPYLEARGQTALKSIHFAPDIDEQKVTVRAELSEEAPEAARLSLQFKTGGVDEVTKSVPKGAKEVRFEVSVPEPHLWNLDDPFLYEVDATLSCGDRPADQLATYFGMRKISVMRLPGTDYPYIALNNRPIYLQTTLDQAYHPEGFYTFPSDDFMREEILRSRRIGLNGMRIHVKIGIPRKLYWADRLGMLIMADVPNSWGQPDVEMRRETETALRGMIGRDYNHPSIFSWVIFNETWGLRSKDKGFTPETQDWVAAMYRLAKSLDPTRLVEDNSPCNYDHVLTDINSWHAYLPGYRWKERLAEFAEKTYPGSTWNYIGGRKQGDQPQFNSECGNVWGYKGSAGDVDWSWDYHLMIDQFRRCPKTCGWLYTEHHDVINEWNGYYRFDRSEKFTGMSELVDGMTIADLHSTYYLSPGEDLCREVASGSTVRVPLWASVMCDFGKPQRTVFLRTVLHGWDTLGRKRTWVRSGARRPVRIKPWMSEEIDPLEVRMPAVGGLAVLAMYLEDPAGKILHRNFTTFVVKELLAKENPAARTQQRPGGGRTVRRIRIAPKDFHDAKWSLKQWNVLEGLKVNGAGWGHFEYRVPWPEGLDVQQVAEATLVLEASAKRLHGKDREGAAEMEGDYMRGRGTLDSSRNPNAYPMTDTVRFPSAVRVRIAGEVAGVTELPDDPADHRGILSWYSQKRDGRLREAGSYGYLVQAAMSPAALRKAAAAKQIVIRLEVDQALPGGLAIYGKRFGRYPLDPTLVLRLKNQPRQSSE